MSALKSKTHLDGEVATITDHYLDSIYTFIIPPEKHTMATAILSYFSVIFRDRAKRKWIIPFLLESETYPKIELSKFQAEYLKARTKYNRVFLFNQLPCSFFSRLYVSVLHRYKQAKIKAWQSEQVFISYHLSHFVTRFVFLSGSISLLLIN